ETRLDDSVHAAALADRTRNGRRALLLTDAIRAVDADAQQVIVAAQPELRELDAPRIASADSAVAASWRTTGILLEARGLAPTSAPPAVTAARRLTAQR